MRLHGVRRPMGRTLARSAAVVSAVRRGEPAREATCDVTNELTGGGVLGVAGRPAHVPKRHHGTGTPYAQRRLSTPHTHGDRASQMLADVGACLRRRARTHATPVTICSSSGRVLDEAAHIRVRLRPWAEGESTHTRVGLQKALHRTGSTHWLEHAASAALEDNAVVLLVKVHGSKLVLPMDAHGTRRDRRATSIALARWTGKNHIVEVLHVEEEVTRRPMHLRRPAGGAVMRELCRQREHSIRHHAYTLCLEASTQEPCKVVPI